MHSCGPIHLTSIHLKLFECASLMWSFRLLFTKKMFPLQIKYSEKKFKYEEEINFDNTIFFYKFQLCQQFCLILCITISRWWLICHFIKQSRQCSCCLDHVHSWQKTLNEWMTVSVCFYEGRNCSLRLLNCHLFINCKIGLHCCQYMEGKYFVLKYINLYFWGYSQLFSYLQLHTRLSNNY